VAGLLGKFYRLGTRRKPELMNREWATTLPDDEAKALRRDYRELLDEETQVAATISEDAKDAFYELVGFPARVLGASGMIFMADRDVQLGVSQPEEGATEMTKWREYLERQVALYNDGTGGGKWKHVMPGLVTGSNLTAWNSQVRWPWGEKPGTSPAKPEKLDYAWQDAATARRVGRSRVAKWTTVTGLGPSGRAVALWPASLKSSWREDDKDAPTLAFDFAARGAGRDLLIDFLPTFRIYPGMQLRVAVTLDDGALQIVEVPGSNGKEDENGPNRRNGVQNNFVRARVSLPALSAGRHTLKIRAVDPGVVIDRVGLPRA
jgi:hypothetical protein